MADALDPLPDVFVSLGAIRQTLEENTAVMAEATSELNRLHRLNKALLAACKGALPFLEGFDDAEFAREHDAVDVILMISEVRAAIAAAEVR